MHCVIGYRDSHFLKRCFSILSPSTPMCACYLDLLSHILAKYTYFKGGKPCSVVLPNMITPTSFLAVAEATVQVSLLSLCCITDLCILLQKESPTTSRQSPANGHSSVNSSILVRTPQSSQMPDLPLPPTPIF